MQCCICSVGTRLSWCITLLLTALIAVEVQILKRKRQTSLAGGWGGRGCEKSEAFFPPDGRKGLGPASCPEKDNLSVSVSLEDFDLVIETSKGTGGPWRYFEEIDHRRDHCLQGFVKAYRSTTIVGRHFLKTKRGVVMSPMPIRISSHPAEPYSFRIVCIAA